MTSERRPPGDITLLLKRLESGDGAAAEELYPQVYGELHQIARAFMKSQSSGHTLQPTALVNEAYLKLATAGGAQSFASRKSFYALGAKAMRSVLVDHARTRNAQKRGGGAERVELERLSLMTDGPTLDVVALDDALTRLQGLQPEQARLVELRFFGGLTAEEAAQTMELPLAKVERMWRGARAWLFRELSGGAPAAG